MADDNSPWVPFYELHIDIVIRSTVKVSFNVSVTELIPIGESQNID